jgi:hypothetical protein
MGENDSCNLLTSCPFRANRFLLNYDHSEIIAGGEYLNSVERQLTKFHHKKKGLVWVLTF